MMSNHGTALERGFLDGPPANLIDGVFRPLPAGEVIISRNPAAPEEIAFQSGERLEDVEATVAAARRAQPAWFAMGKDARIEVLLRWKEVTAARAPRMAELITLEMGKVLSESRFEAGALAGKVDITLGEHSAGRIADYEVAAGETKSGLCRYKPHGVMAVLGPFNFPAHLPNGHLIPALLAGNAIILKPSEKTPGVGQALAEMAMDHGCTVAELIFGFALEVGMIPLTGTTNADNMRGDLGVFTLGLEPDEISCIENCAIG